MKKVMISLAIMGLFSVPTVSFGATLGELQAVATQAITAFFLHLNSVDSTIAQTATDQLDNVKGEQDFYGVVERAKVAVENAGFGSADLTRLYGNVRRAFAAYFQQAQVADQAKDKVPAWARWMKI